MESLTIEPSLRVWEMWVKKEVDGEFRSEVLVIEGFVVKKKRSEAVKDFRKRDGGGGGRGVGSMAFEARAPRRLSALPT